MFFKLNGSLRMIEKVLKGESVLSIQFKPEAKGHCCHQLLRKETEIEIAYRKITEQCPGDPHLQSSEGNRNGQREFNCDTGATKVSGQSHRIVLKSGLTLRLGGWVFILSHQLVTGYRLHS